ncbi:hypothetical protein ACH5RR_011427 [Cinchona calisaya]|uniref:Uncharacterized protein n=1 Tax=Cinchona calisaya TaxID=153742 RepID=A0ABD3A4V7_9GENT
MACLDMYNNQNNDRKPLGAAPISPRISFSNDFVESTTTYSSSHPQMVRPSYRDAPVSSDFEFSVTNYSMMSADQLFSQGRLLPLKESCSSTNQFIQKTTTLRDELLQVEDDDYDDDFSLRPPKNSSTRWKGFLGLKKSHIGSKKFDKSEGPADNKRASFIHEEVHQGKPPQVQEMHNDGGSSSNFQDE